MDKAHEIIAGRVAELMTDAEKAFQRARQHSAIMRTITELHETEKDSLQMILRRAREIEEELSRLRPPKAPRAAPPKNLIHLTDFTRH